jgi:hypothetical protein
VTEREVRSCDVPGYSATVVVGVGFVMLVGIAAAATRL